MAGLWRRTRGARMLAPGIDGRAQANVGSESIDDRRTHAHEQPRGPLGSRGTRNPLQGARDLVERLDDASRELRRAPARNSAAMVACRSISVGAGAAGFVFRSAGNIWTLL